jgi:transcriptional regulator with XRE-family HTH domain
MRVPKNNVPDNLGSVIKTARKSKRLTQKQLAEKLCISPRYLKAIENSGRKPSYDLLNRAIYELEIAAELVFFPESNK